MSGAFSTKFINQSLQIDFQHHSRKIFRSSEQAKEYFADHKRAFYTRLGALLPKLDEAWSRARESGAALIPVDLSHRILRWSDAPALNEESFPLAVEFENDNIDSGTLKLRVSLSETVAAEQLEALQQALFEAYQGRAEEGREGLELTRPVALNFYDRYGILVSTLAETDQGNAEGFNNQCREVLERIEGPFGQRFSSERVHELGAELLDLASLIDSRVEPFDLFNLWGPLVDDSDPPLLRTAWEGGALKIIVLISQRDYDWGKVNLGLRQWFEEIMD